MFQNITKFSFIHDQFTRMFSDKCMFCTSLILEKKHLTEQNSICIVENHTIGLPACVQYGMTLPNNQHFADAIYKVSVVALADPRCSRH